MHVRIPCYGEVRIDDQVVDARAIYESPQFQRLRHTKQLGQTHLIFPGGAHSRLEHSLGAFALTKDLLGTWHRLGLASMADVVGVSVFALVHDIGHFPFSHTLEPILESDHHEHGKEIVRGMSEALARCGTSVETVVGCWDGTHPLACAVSDRHLGTEKIDYLRRDAHHTGYGGFPETETVLACLRPLGGRLGLLKRAWREGRKLVQFSQDMYELVYERSRSNYARRLVQKLYERLSACKLIDERMLTTMTDAQFEGLCAATDDAAVRWLYKHYTGGRPLPWTGLLVCVSPHGKTYRRNDKPHRAVIELDEASFETLVKKVTWKNAGEHERRCADRLRCDSADIFVVPPRNPDRFRAPSLELIDGNEHYPLSEAEDGDRLRASRVQVLRIGSTDHEVLSSIAKEGAMLMKALWS